MWVHHFDTEKYIRWRHWLFLWKIQEGCMCVHKFLLTKFNNPSLNIYIFFLSLDLKRSIQNAMVIKWRLVQPSYKVTEHRSDNDAVNVRNNDILYRNTEFGKCEWNTEDNFCRVSDSSADPPLGREDTGLGLVTQVEGIRALMFHIQIQCFLRYSHFWVSGLHLRSVLL